LLDVLLLVVARRGCMLSCLRMTPVQKIKERYAFEKGWATLAEVEPPLMGTRARRYDAIAISLWRSMGCQIHGFEVKVSRSDWLREIADPTKADTLMQHCSHWWLVCPKEIITDLSEVPETWGIMFLTDTGLRIARKAQRLTNHPPSADFWRCMLLRQATRVATPDEITTAVEKAKDALLKSRANEHLDTARRLKDLEETVKRFETETGIRINSFGVHNEIKMVKTVRSLNLENLLPSLERAANVARESRDTLSRAIDRIETARSELSKGNADASCG